MTAFPEPWIRVARYERDRRAASYPRLVASGQLDEERANLDFQAWCAIAQWMAEGRCSLIGGWGGVADPPVTVLTWAVLEESAATALASIEDRLVQADDARRDQLQRRRDAVFGIHAILVRQRDLATMTDRLVADARARWASEKAVAA